VESSVTEDRDVMLSVIVIMNVPTAVGSSALLGARLDAEIMHLILMLGAYATLGSNAPTERV